MSSETQAAPNPKWMSVTGWIISILLVLALGASATFKFIKPGSAEQAEGLAKSLEHIGWRESLLFGLGILELACAITYLIPRSSVLGAILLTGYLGGAVATHVRVGDAFFAQVLLGVAVWLGLFFRDARLRALLPFRKDPEPLSLLISIPATLVAIGVTLLAVVALQPGEYRITRSATMAAPPAEVFAQVNDFRKWDGWNPWLKLDPATKVTLEGPPAGNGAVYKWSGNEKVGQGMMTVTDSVPDDRVRIKLHFISPMEAIADTDFTFKTEKDKTVVTQTMTGQRDLMAKAFSLVMNMDTMIGGKFEEGLASMKAIVEKKK